MNYERIKQQAAMKKFIKAKLFEKQDKLRSLDGLQRAKAEKLIIAKAKEEFKMGYSNKKSKKSDEEKSQTPETPETQDATETPEGEEGSEGGESEEGSSDSVDLESMSEEELIAYAKEHKINVGNTKKKEKLIQKIKGE